MTGCEGTGLPCRAGYDRFLPLFLALAINAALFAVAPVFLEQTATPDLARHARLNLLMPVRPQTPPEPEPEREPLDKPPELELMPMKLEPLATPPEVPEMSPPELNMPKPEIPEAASAPDIAPIKPLAAPLPPMRSIVSVPGRGPYDPRRISETGAGISGTEGAGPAHTGAAHAPVRQRGYEIGQVDVAPKAVGQSLPAYPRKARRMGIEGWVKVRFLVNKEGGVEHLKILEESPVDIFYKAVMSTVPGWRFRPAQKEGKAVDVWVDQTIKFKMETW